ncbi:MAG: type IV conjugative transfer system protein TraE [Ideonella sp. MAG2]|nr:MAG: type IV conjugative transfer system protein TraE [Ideonella sp. MAG2]
MTPDRHLQQTKDQATVLKQQRLLLILLSCALLALSVALLTKSHTTVLEVPSRSRTITITGDRVDGAWLEEMGLYLSHLTLDATPASVGWQHEQILKYVHPELYGALQAELAVQAKRLVDANAATVFWPTQVAPDVKGQRVVVIGRLDTYVNNVKVASGSDVDQAYMASFQARGGRALLKQWQRVPMDDPWLLRLQEEMRKAEEAKEKQRAKK